VDCYYNIYFKGEEKMSAYYCKKCGHVSGYHGYSLRKILNSSKKCPCKIASCSCGDFALEDKDKHLRKKYLEEEE